jgi:hypothetical protein
MAGGGDVSWPLGALLAELSGLEASLLAGTAHSHLRGLQLLLGLAALLSLACFLGCLQGMWQKGSHSTMPGLLPIARARSRGLV